MSAPAAAKATTTSARRIIRLKPRAMTNYCKANDIPRNELARRMGVDYSTAFRVEKGDTGPSPTFIAELMHTTGLPFEDLFEVVEAAA